MATSIDPLIDTMLLLSDARTELWVRNGMQCASVFS
jgi:hypothetical protein